MIPTSMPSSCACLGHPELLRPLNRPAASTNVVFRPKFALTLLPQVYSFVCVSSFLYNHCHRDPWKRG